MENKQQDIFDKGGKFMSENPIYFALFGMALGAFLLYVSIVDANWIFGGLPSYNEDKIEGMVTMFGRKTTRVITGIGGVAVILYAIFMLILLLQ